LSAGDFKSRGFIAVIAAAVGSSVLAFVIALVMSAVSPTGNSRWLTDLTDVAVVAAIVLIWAPAFALIPAALLGYFVERPKARWMIASDGSLPLHLVLHFVLSLLAAAVLFVLFRIVLQLFDPTKPLLDLFGFGLFMIIGVGSGLAWWFLVVLPERRK
jgi:hypothetical protein